MTFKQHVLLLVVPLVALACATQAYQEKWICAQPGQPWDAWTWPQIREVSDVFTAPNGRPHACTDCPPGWTGIDCGTPRPYKEVPYVASRTIGNMTFGPYVCGITAPCHLSGYRWTPSGECGVNYTTNSMYAAIGPCELPVVKESSLGCIGGPFYTRALSGTFMQWQPAPFCSPDWQYLPFIDCDSYASDPVSAMSAWPSTCGVPPNTVHAPCSTHIDKCRNGTCVRQGYHPTFLWVDGSLVSTKNEDICCPFGFMGSHCQIDVGCEVAGCLHGGKCLSKDQYGRPVAPSDQHCYGCDTGVNGTAGWGGRFCHVQDTPTYTEVPVEQVPGTGGAGGAGRRLLQSETGNVMVRASSARTSERFGVIYREPSRACDCGVSWDEEAPDTLMTKKMMLNGNYDASPSELVVLSPILYGPEVDRNQVKPFYLRTVGSLAEAKADCAADWACGGVYYNNYTRKAGCWSDATRLMEGRTLAAGPTLASLVPSTLNFTRYTLTRQVKTSMCASTDLDPAFYCSEYPRQCRAIVDNGGVGNVRVDATASNTTLAYLHFHAFGHRIRNRPNALCDLTVDYAEDEVGCVNKLRSPKIYYTLPPGVRLSDEDCGNSSRIEPDLVEFGPLLPGVTGKFVTDSGDDFCSCNPPFTAADAKRQQDCAWTLCAAVDDGTGRIVEGRGRVNATYANSLQSLNEFNHTNPEACVCEGVWGTDPATCTGKACKWCAATMCQNGGVASGSNYSAPCECNRLFMGELCEINLCNAANSYPFNYSDWKSTGNDREWEQIACDCKPGWAPPLCDERQCANGQMDYAMGACVCYPGYKGEKCEEFICDPDRSKYVEAALEWRDVVVNRTVGNLTVYDIVPTQVMKPAHCECQPPWTGPSCHDHTCDLTNVVLNMRTWDGQRPFGRPVISPGNNATWECGCNWPFAPRRYLQGRPIDCELHSCNYGYPNKNASRVHTPTDACTCEDPHDIGILTDPRECKGWSSDKCPNACMRASCKLSQEYLDNLGGYVPVGSSGPDCCMCPASMGKGINGECQPFCQFVQPCLTTNTSSFVMNNDYDPNKVYPYPTPEYFREVNASALSFSCKCSVGYTSVDPNLNDCSILTLTPIDIPIEEGRPDYGLDVPPGYPGDSDSNEGGSSGSSEFVDNKPALYSVVAAGSIFVLAGVVSLYQQYLLSVNTATGGVEKLAEASPMIPQSTPSPPSVPPALGSRLYMRRSSWSTGAKPRTTLLVALFVLALCGAHAVSAQNAPFIYPDTNYTMDRVSSCIMPDGGIFRSAGFWLDVGAIGPRRAQPRTCTGSTWELYTYWEQFPAPVKSNAGPYESSFLGNDPGEMVRIEERVAELGGTGTVLLGSVQVPRTDVRFSVIRRSYAFDDFANVYDYALSICDNDINRGCGGHGVCEFGAAFSLVENEQWNIACTFTQQCTYSFTLMPYAQRAIEDRHAYHVRTCRCDDGWYGLRCQYACPTGNSESHTHPLCYGRGKCASNTSTRDEYDGRMCLCKGGCECQNGYEGDRCERAIQTRGKPSSPARVALTDFTTCCPVGHPDCSPIASHRETVSDIRRFTGPCDNFDSVTGKCAFIEPTTYDFHPSKRLDDAYVCGETNNAAVAGWAQGAGRGKCYVAPGVFHNGTVTSETRTMCWCNTYASTTHAENGRRGWTGTNCQIRTCTRRVETPTWVPGSDGKAKQLTNAEMTLPDGSLQCADHAAPHFKGRSTNYNDEQPCEDRAVPYDAGRGVIKYSNVNSEGRCVQCADGWGLYEGFSPQDMQRMGYAFDTGLCHRRTYHSNSGAQCGGYGISTIVNSSLWSRNQTYPTTVRPTVIPRVTACTCPVSWGLTAPAENGGICQRSCSTAFDLPAIPFNLTDAYGNYIGRDNRTFVANLTAITETRCGSYRQGMCRPITAGVRNDGWNSACMCNAGYNGPRCEKDEDMWFKGTVCGPDGEPVLQSPANNTQRLGQFDDEDWFNRFIVPMNDEASLNSKTLYSAYRCRCKREATAKGYVLNPRGICARGCGAMDLQGENGHVCSGHGRCIDDPRVGDGYTAGKVCQCELGWDGLNCGRRNLRDWRNQVCGGMDETGHPRGAIVYADQHNMTQRCQCNSPYIPNPRLGPTNALCWSNCTSGPNGIACTSEQSGKCVLDPATGNDNVCECTKGAYMGKACEIKLVSVVVLQSGTQLPCSAHGEPDPELTGRCICYEGYEGPACEVFNGNRQCGWGQTFLDTESVGIVVR